MWWSSLFVYIRLWLDQQCTSDVIQLPQLMLSKIPGSLDLKLINYSYLDKEKSITLTLILIKTKLSFPPHIFTKNEKQILDFSNQSQLFHLFLFFLSQNKPIESKFEIRFRSKKVVGSTIIVLCLQLREY